jgi:hypothetical protein
VSPFVCRDFGDQQVDFSVLSATMCREAVHSLTESAAHVLFEVSSASLKSQIIIPKHEGLRENDAKGIPRYSRM